MSSKPILVIVAGFLGFLLIILGISVIIGYNGLVNKDEAIDNQISQISIRLDNKDNVLEEMLEAITNLQDYSLEVYTLVTNARIAYANASNSGNIDDLAEADELLTDAYDRFLVVIEDNNLESAVPGYMILLEEIHTTNGLIAQARRDYNQAVTDYRTAVRRFPGVIYARWFGFDREVTYWEDTEE